MAPLRSRRARVRPRSRRKPPPSARSAAPGRGSSGRATYLYAVVASTREPTAEGAPDGLPETGRLRWLPVGDGLWLAAADAPLDRYRAEAIEKGLKDLEWVSACAVAHERMVEHVSGLGTAVPMKLFTLFSTDARAVADVGRTRRTLRAVLSRIQGRQEWGVRVSVDEVTARASARTRAERAAEGLSAGARFLTRKRQEHKEVRDIVELGRGEADAVFDELALYADQTRRRAPAAAEPGLRLLLDAAFLVAVPRTAAFREAVRRQAERLAPQGYRVVLTGPWPAYNFVAGTQ
jgi:hypothetical protein